MSERDEKKGSGSSSSREKEEGGGGGWGSTFLKVASAAAAAATVAGGLYALLNQPEPETEAGHILEGRGVQRQQNKEKWTKPEEGWVKLNVDGSLKPESAGCGGVLRDSYGNWICGFVQKLPQPSGHYPHKVEKEAICRGLRWAWERGVRKVAVESDHEGTVDFVKGGRKTTDSDICEIRDLLYNRDWEACTLDKISGEDANKVADILADIARDWPSFELRVFDSPHEKCLHALFKDAR